ncbi:MAG: hypothetical protein HRF44_06755 [Ignavibacterium sp.]|jgi:hypothetical protein
MKRHLTETEIDFLVFNPGELSQRERQEWTAHVDRCSICRAHHDLAIQFRDEVNAKLNQSESRDDSAIADRIAGTSLALQLSFGSLKPPDDLLGTAVERSGSLRGGLRRFIETAARYPVRTAGAGLLAAALIVLTNFLLPSPPAELHTARIHNGILTAYDENGNALWTKPARGMPEGSTDTDFMGPEGPVGPSKPLIVADIHSRAGTELLLFWASIPQVTDPSFSPESLYCFASNGDVLWVNAYQPKEFAEFAKEKKGSWRINRVLDFKDKGATRRHLFVSTFYTPFSPSALLEINPENGLPVQQYCHFGYMHPTTFIDRATGKTRIMAFGTNNALSRPFLLKLDPENLSGFGPTAGDPLRYGYSGGPGGSELLYITFPRTFLADRFDLDRQNHIGEILQAEDGSLVVEVRELQRISRINPQLRGSVHYSLDPNWRVSSVTFSDELLQSHRRLLREGHVLPPLDSAYAEELKNAVQYWNGKTFVPFQATAP